MIQQIKMFSITILVAIGATVASGQTPDNFIEKLPWSHSVGPTMHDFFDFYYRDMKFSDEFAVKRRNDIENLKNRLSDSNLSKDQASMLMAKLAELFIEQGHYEWRKAYNQAKESFQFSMDGPQENHISFKDEEAKKWFFDGANQLRELLKLNPKHNANAKTLFQLGLVLANLGDENSAHYLKKTLRVKPRKKYYAWAKLALAEMYMNNDKNSQALKIYKKLSRSKNQDIKDYAQYRLSLMELISKPKKSTVVLNKLSRKSDHWATLVKTGVTLVCAKSKNEQCINRFEKDKQSEYRVAYHLRVANAQVKEENLKNAFSSLDSASAAEKQLQKWFLIKERQVLLAYKLGAGAYVANQIEQVASKAAGSEKDYAEGFVVAKRLLDNYGKLYDLAYKKEKNVANLNIARAIYKTYVEKMPKSHVSGDVRWTYAVLLEDAKQFIPAAIQYYLAYESDGLDMSRKRLALDKAFAILAQSIPELQQVVSTPIKSLPKQVDFDSLDNLFVRLVGSLNRAKHIAAPQARMHLANLYLIHGQKTAALSYQKQVVKTYPAHPDSARYITNVNDIYLISADFDEIIAANDQFLSYGDLNAPAKQVSLKWLASGLWSSGERNYSQKKFAAASQRFERFVTLFPRDPKAASALYFAFESQNHLGKGDEANRMVARLLKDYKSSSHAELALFKMGGIYEKMLQFEDSARTYQLHAMQYPTSDRSSVSLLEAVQNFEAAENIDAAIRVMKNFVTKYPKSSQAEDGIFKVAQMYQAAGNKPEAMRWYQSYLDKSQGKNVNAKLISLANISIMSANSTKSNVLISELAKLPSNQGVNARQALCQEHFNSMNVEFGEFPNASVGVIDLIEFKESHQKFTVRLNEMVNKFMLLTKIGDPSCQVEAYYKIGEVYDKALSAYVKNPGKDDLPRDELQELISAKEKVMVGLEKRRDAVWQNGLKISKQNKVLSLWAVKTADDLARKNNNKNNYIQEEILRPQIIVDMRPQS